jgi:hypothetical protein
MMRCAHGSGTDSPSFAHKAGRAVHAEAVLCCLSMARAHSVLKQLRVAFPLIISDIDRVSRDHNGTSPPRYSPIARTYLIEWCGAQSARAGYILRHLCSCAGRRLYVLSFYAIRVHWPCASLRHFSVPMSGGLCIKMMVISYIFNA